MENRKAITAMGGNGWGLGALALLCVLASACMWMPEPLFNPPDPASAGATNGAQTELVELNTLIPDILLDIRYATENNFTGQRVYPSARCFLARPAAEALARVERDLRNRGYRLIVYDGYRPLSVQRRFWEVLPDPRYVADPAEGSRHNRGYAVDVTLADSAGNPLPMPTDFDDFSEMAAADYPHLPPDRIRNRQVLQAAMERQGFEIFPTEWWHFDFPGWQDAPLLDVPIESVGGFPVVGRYAVRGWQIEDDGKRHEYAGTARIQPFGEGYRFDSHVDGTSFAGPALLASKGDILALGFQGDDRTWGCTLFRRTAAGWQGAWTGGETGFGFRGVEVWAPLGENDSHDDLEGLTASDIYDFEATRSVVDLVNNAAWEIARRGAAVFAEMNQPGPWYDPDTGRHVFVMDAQRVQHVCGPRPEWVGKPLETADKRSRRHEARIFQEGEPAIWGHGEWPHPQTGELAWFSAFMRRVQTPDGQIYMVGSGEFDLPMERRFVEEMVKDAVRQIEGRGVAAFDDLRDPDGPYRLRDLYLFITSADGVERFNPAFPEYEGKDLSDLKDSSGIYFVREYVRQALTAGGGWSTYPWPRPGSDRPERKHTYTRTALLDGEPVVVGSGLYFDHDLEAVRANVEAKTVGLARKVGWLTPQDQEKIHSMLRAHLERNVEIFGAAWIAVFEKDGKALADMRYICRIDRPGGFSLIESVDVNVPYREASHADWLVAAVDSGALAWSKPYDDVLGVNPDVQMITCVVPVRDREGAIVAYVTGDVVLP